VNVVSVMPESWDWGVSRGGVVIVVVDGVIEGIATYKAGCEAHCFWRVVCVWLQRSRWSLLREGFW